MNTVTIVVPDHPDGRVVINESDFDPATQTLWTPDPEPEPAPEPEPEPAPRKGKK